MKNDSTKKIGKVTRWPKCFLGLLGRYHASYGGKEVIDTNIRKWTDRLAVSENEVIKAEEKAMLPLRESAAKALSSALRTDSELADMIKAGAQTDTDSDISGDIRNLGDPKSIRAVRSERAKAAAKECAVHDENRISTDDIIRLNENIISMNVRLREYLDELRNNCRICIDCYLVGVKAVMPDYTPAVSLWSDKALDIYTFPHKTLDDAVRRLAYAMINDISEKEA